MYCVHSLASNLNLSFGVILLFQLFAESKDEVGLVLFGTEGTANHLSDDGYEKITEARPVAPVNLDLIKHIKTDIKPGPQSADCILNTSIGKSIKSLTWS